MMNLLGFFKCGRGHSEEDLLFVLPGAGSEFYASDLKNFDLVCDKDGEEVAATLISIPNGVPRGEGKPINVECSEGSDMPQAFMINQVKFEIDEIEAVIRLFPRHRPPPQLLEDTLSKSFGIYLVSVGQVRCIIEARPHKEPDGELDWSNPQWYLIDMDKSGVVYDFVEVSRQRSESGKVGDKLTQIDTGVPPNNINAYRYLYRLENYIRKFVTSKLQEKYPDQGKNKKWWKALLPKNVRDDIEKQIKEVSKNPWFSSKGPDDPMSYTTFGQLREIIEKKEEAFKDSFSSKDMTILLGNLTMLEFLRNKVAHNRPLGSKEFKKLEQIAEATGGAIGKRG
ncbi:hypothetical protein LR007_03730 [candidate division NPL-UPA2 bacterium]|nr:hypothetical protein [candidate division NPL-UPA2 bacterium]